MPLIEYSQGGRPPHIPVGNDCSVRALAIATGRPYEEVLAEMEEYQDQHMGRHISIVKHGIRNSAFSSYLKKNGWRGFELKGLSVRRLLELPPCTVLVRLNTHVMAMKNNVVFDSYNSIYRARRIESVWIREEDLCCTSYTPVNIEPLPDMPVKPTCMMSLNCGAKATWKVDAEWMGYKFLLYACDKHKGEKHISSVVKNNVSSKRGEALQFITAQWEKSGDVDVKWIFDELMRLFPENGREKNALYLRWGWKQLQKGIKPK